MREKKILVPEGMLTAACTANHGGSGPLVNVLEAALLWLSENPIVPKKEDIGSMQNCLDGYGIVGWGPILCAEWQRRMFLAPEPEVKFYRKVGDEYIEIENPSEELKAMFSIPPGGGKTACIVTAETEMIGQETINEFCSRYRWIRDAVIEAYRRGKESK